MGMEGGREKWGQIKNERTKKKMGASMLVDYGFAFGYFQLPFQIQPMPFHLHQISLLNSKYY